MVKNLAGLPIEKYVKTYNAMANIYTEKKCIRNAFARLIIRCPVSLLFATYHEPILAECMRISRQKTQPAGPLSSARAYWQSYGGPHFTTAGRRQLAGVN
jgi:hypothetical protein